MDLFAAGLEHNTTAGVDLAKNRKAFLQHSTSLDSLRPIEKRVVDEVQAEGNYSSSTVGGVHAVVTDSVQLFSLGYASRRIPSRRWKISSAIDNQMGRCIYPGADIIAFVERQIQMCVH